MNYYLTPTNGPLLLTKVFKNPALNYPFRCCSFFPDSNTHPLINPIGLFIAHSHDRRHIVPYLLGLVACSACIIASFRAEAAVQALWMNWLSARGWKMALIPLWCHATDKEKRGSFMKPPIHWFASFSLFSPSAHSPQLSHPSPTQDAPLLSSLTPSCLAHPCRFQPKNLALAAKIPISHPRSAAQAKMAANLVLYVCMCVYVSHFNSLRCKKYLCLRLG